MRVLVLDRIAQNPYSEGLAGGLRGLGVEVVIGGPANEHGELIRPIYPRGGVSGQRPQKALELLASGPRYLHLLRTLQPDVVHVQWPGFLYYAHALTAARIGGAGVVFTDHNPIARLGDPTTRWHDALLRRADAVIVHGPVMRSSLCEQRPWIESRVHVVEHGSYEHSIASHSRAEARRRLGLTHDGPVYAFVGQLRPRKGIETLLDAYAAEPERRRMSQLVIAGHAPDFAYVETLRERGRELGIAPRWIVSRDILRREVLDEVVCAANEVVLPFVSATQSGSVILAMTHGRCVVATTVGELPRTLDDRGILVPPDDVGALSEAMRPASESPDLCDELGRRARDYARTELDWPALAERTLAVYRSVAS
jgi:glycosyltransferase involved in cell wall biosynthesis